MTRTRSRTAGVERRADTPFPQSSRGLRAVVTAVPAALLAVVLLAGCSSDAEPALEEEAAASPSSPAEPPATDQSPAADEEEATATDAALDSVEAFLDRVGSGIESATSAHVEMRVSGGPAAMSASGDADYSGDSPATSMELRTPMFGDTALRMIQVDGRSYVSVPALVPRGKWIAVPSKGHGLADLADTSDNLSLQTSRKVFERSVRKVEDRGTATIDGETVDHYRVTVDTATALDAQGVEAPAGTPRTTTYDVYLDGQDRMRRMTFALAGTKTVMDFTDWGKEVRVRAPAKSDIIASPLDFG